MGSSTSKPDVEVDDGEVSFFANRDAPVQFSEGLMSQLSANSLPTINAQPSAARQETLDAHIQARINQELSRLQGQEASVKEEIERALEKENLDRERGEDGQPGVSHSVTLHKDLEELERRTLGLREEIVKGKEGVAWAAVDSGRKALEECFLGNKATPLNCREQAQAFKESVAGVEQSFVQSIH